MTHYYEKNIVDIKNEYTEFLITIMTPLIYEGFKSYYLTALNYEIKYKEAEMKNPNIKNIGVLKLFQKILSGVPNMNNNKIEGELIRIRDKCKYADIFEILFKAVIKSNIILLTFNASGKTCKLVQNKYHDKADIKMFIHKCYIESARYFYNYPELFWHKYETLEIKKNQREIFDIIKKSIIEAIRKMLPMKEILDEYLKNEYIVEESDDAKYRKIKNSLEYENYRKDNYSESKNIFMNESENNVKELENNIDELDKIIYESDNKNNTNLNNIFEHKQETQQKSIIQEQSMIQQENKPATQQDIHQVIETKPILEKTVLNSDDEFKQKIQSGNYLTSIPTKKYGGNFKQSIKLEPTIKQEENKNDIVRDTIKQMPIDNQNPDLFIDNLLKI